MKACPFCREEIRDEAIKCPFCLSSLTSERGTEDALATRAAGPHRVVFSIDRDLIRWAKFSVVVVAIFVTIGVLLYLYGFNAKQPGPKPDQVVYVLDQGLIRFAKFAAAALAVFVTIGVFLYGFNLKEVAKEIREIANSVRELHRQATVTNDEIRKSKDAVAADRSESEKLLRETRNSIISTKAAQKKIAAEVEENRQQLALVIEQGKSSISEFDVAFHSRIELLADSRTETPVAEIAPVRGPGFTVPELSRLYDFPTEFNGRGQCIGLIELGGGYKNSDLKTYFNQLGLQMPKVTWVSVGGGKNRPSRDGGGADAQVTLDIEVAGAAAPGAHIVVYFAPNTTEGFVEAVKAAVDDKINNPSILSISWGAPEANWTMQALAKFDQAFQTAATGGITVVCAAGDNGVIDGIQDGKAHVDFPASSPWVLACGGTRLTAAKQTVQSEVVWNDGASATGGGISNVFPLPDWQSEAKVPAGIGGHIGRGIPDVAASASPQSGYRVFIGHSERIVGGTAAATPLWAGLIALLNEGLGRNIGNVNRELYSSIGPAGVLRSITEGNNGLYKVKGYSAGPGWNACTGWGSPRGKRLLEALRSGSNLPAA